MYLPSGAAVATAMQVTYPLFLFFLLSILTFFLSRFISIFLSYFLSSCISISIILYLFISYYFPLSDFTDFPKHVFHLFISSSSLSLYYSVAFILICFRFFIFCISENSYFCLLFFSISLHFFITLLYFFLSIFIYCICIRLCRGTVVI